MGRAPGPGESRWTPEDTALAVEWQRLRNETCGGCGQPLEQSLDTYALYEVHDLVCHGCEAKELREKAMAENANSSTAGRKVSVSYAGRREPVPSLTPSAGG
ncbi:hypothetical protein [Actinacidiphila sp. ITFR-21]|uniref:hypothetical protein n=1 Tax=Actinacidiphila sp. ITFR-21 TaxID=3075199 RepID=UPI00288BC7D0|nr:hypothetical protein [Streptomyces sp. ITFR-21]WNI16612.1 hypothetical protein RLT57_14570 [Streptomyces sp. ITFR-21]